MNFRERPPWKQNIKSICLTMIAALVMGGIMLFMAGCVNQQKSTRTPYYVNYKKTGPF